MTPKFSVVPKNPTEVFEGSTVMIDCKAYGEPTPTIQWDKNNIINGFDNERYINMTLDWFHVTKEQI